MLQTPLDMTPHLGKTIDKFCQRSLGLKLNLNHCAHFVSHMMEYDALPTTCRNLSDADKALPEKGAGIRVNEIFNRSPGVGYWADRPLGLTSCLMFATITSNMRECGSILAMDDKAQKHVGIYHAGVVWHYGESKYGVVKMVDKVFITTYRHLYLTAGDTVKFFYGRFLK